MQSRATNRTRALLNTPERALRRQERHNRRSRLLVALGILFLIVVGLLAWGAHHPSVRVSAISVEGNQVVSSSDVKMAGLKALSGKYFFFLPRDNAFLYSDKKLSSALAYEFKDFKTVDVSLDGLTAIKVRVTERTPKALWCGVSTAEPTTPCFFVDAQGLVYAEAPNFSSGVYLELYGALTATSLANQEQPLGYGYWDSAHLALLTVLTERAGEILAPARSFALGDTQATIVFANGGTLMLTPEQDFEQLPEILQTAVTAKVAEGKDMAMVNYIDLRLADTAGKVYFKFK